MRGDIETGEMSVDEHDPARRLIRETMKSTQSPYAPFDKYYSLEDTIDMYNDIWYDSSESI